MKQWWTLFCWTKNFLYTVLADFDWILKFRTNSKLILPFSSELISSRLNETVNVRKNDNMKDSCWLLKNRFCCVIIMNIELCRKVAYGRFSDKRAWIKFWISTGWWIKDFPFQTFSKIKISATKLKRWSELNRSENLIFIEQIARQMVWLVYHNNTELASSVATPSVSRRPPVMCRVGWEHEPNLYFR